MGVPGRKKGGIFYGVHNWWSNLDAAKQRTLISEAGQLGYHLTDPKVGVFNVPAIGARTASGTHGPLRWRTSCSMRPSAATWV